MTKTFKIDSSIIHKILISIIMLNVWLTEMPKVGMIYTEFKNLVLGFIIICIVFEILLSKYTLKLLFLTLVMLSLGLFLYFKSNILWPFYLIYFICFSRNIKLKEYLSLIKKILMFIFCVNISIFSLQFILSPETLDVITSRGLLRYYINFESPNGAARALVCIVLIHFMNLNRKMSFYEVIVFSTLGFFFYYFTNSATVFAIVLIFLFDYLQENQSIKNLVAKLARWCIPLATLFSIFSVKFYPNYCLTFFDKIMTGRISLAQKSLEYYGYTLLGQPVNIPQWALTNDGSYQLLTCDNTYIYIIICLGSLLLLPLLLFSFYSIKKLDYKINIGIIIFSIFTLIYYDTFSPLCSFPLIAVAISKYENTLIVNNK